MGGSYDARRRTASVPQAQMGSGYPARLLCPIRHHRHNVVPHVVLAHHACSSMTSPGHGRLHYRQGCAGSARHRTVVAVSVPSALPCADVWHAARPSRPSRPERPSATAPHKDVRVGASLCLSKLHLHSKVAFVTVSNDNARVHVPRQTCLESAREWRRFDGLNRPTIRFTGPARRP